MFRMALHSTVLTHALYSAGGGTLQRLSLVLCSTRWVLDSTQPTQYFYSTGWVFSPVLLQHWVSTLQHPKVPGILTALRGYFTAPTILRVLHSTLLWPLSDTLQHRGHQVPTLRYWAIISCYLCVQICWWTKLKIGSLNLFPAIMGWPSTIFQSCVQVGFLRISPYMFWIACKCFETVLEFLRLWLANRSPHSPANRRLVSKECQTHCTLLKYEINLLERKPKTLRIERLRQLDRAAVKVSCNKLCESVVNCVKTSYLDITYSIDRCWL